MNNRNNQGSHPTYPQEAWKQDDDSKYLESDKKLLEKYGEKALIEFGYFGVLDRLKRAGIKD